MACVIDDQRSDSAQPRPRTTDENSCSGDSASDGSASALPLKRVSWWRRAWGILPQVGAAGSRSAHLHVAEDEFGDDLSRYDNVSVLVKAASGVDLLTPSRDGSVIPFGTLPESKSKNLTRPESRRGFVFPTLGYQELRRFAFLRWLGTLGALLLGFGALGAGAMPVVNSPYAEFPGGSLMWRMLQTSTMLCFVGVSLIVVAWLLMAPFTGVALRRGHVRTGVISMSMMRRTFLVWSLPIVASAPMFTQDIYSYLANGSIIRLGLDPYSGGPIDLLGTENVLARSVPFIWAHSSSPYGPVALGVAAIISWLTNDSIVLGVIAHRITAIAGVALAGWAVVQLARRCRVIPQAALWLGILNPLTILHLVGGIHNESILLGLLLAGVELGLRAADYLRLGLFYRACWLLVASGFLISCAGMVKVTGFIGLGFIGMAVARSIRLREHSVLLSWIVAILAQTVLLCVSVALVTWMSGISLGWISGQGGAATIRSWMSMSTAIGVVFSWVAEQLALGNHSDAMLVVTRMVGIAIAGVFMVRMLLATYAGRIHPVGALGVSTFVMVIFFPVVHPWYMLWAILPLSAWANRELFRGAVIAYTLVLSFFVLPRGLGLPPTTVLSIYIASIFGFGIIIGSSYVILKRRGVIGLH
ncbi:polyprenol phosphomannose-dependent alpha 1,6 mannosyltransferase MptB [Corynebacterium felinum]|uniref:Alpha-1,6-mannosyltransferase n=1 Tax=Corynebacterium felinum TaxID=131318 RepID=A0ABU2BAP9_9CORY|nr:polyprenol phosphomannose-dependent alpha 1,6 mannosyltransferase MptB [Corynebacterium felinum]MDF5821986.1 polyprenol phosphomannose-dependent alpha 1,6 mannosyltransferase MptB [Corynebacterium felinum]MDR7355717.1 alpha-1,6-mannosyltransferase [Corynebacterium felinum]WJY95066.1 hypothetical protein CFELI_07260 [Corynebacterium felinum]